MDFFHSQEVARRKTALLVFYFALAVVAIVVSVYVALMAAFSGTDVPLDSLWNPTLFGVVTGCTLLVVLGGSLYKMATLRGGGESVAQLLGGVPLNPQAAGVAERRLLNIVEEMAIASGMPVPPVYLLDEPGINAFAAGFSPADAVIGVTRGCLERLNRDQLQGVIAHEFSHILNGDMRLNIRLMGVLFGILVIAIIGRMLLRTAHVSSSRSRSSRKGGNPLPLIGLVLMIVGYIGVFFGKLIKSAVSRQREFLADASAVQFTRNPDGIAGALKTIGGFAAGSRLLSPRAEEASHLYFANGLGRSFTSLLATHPPLDERIRRIDPSFVTGAGPDAAPQPLDTPDALSAFLNRRPSPPPLPRTAPASHPAAGVLAQIGNPQPAHVAYAERLLAALPEAVAKAARDPLAARACLYGLLASADGAVRERQIDGLRTGPDGEAHAPTLQLLPDIQALPRALRFPLVSLALPALRRLTTEQYDAFQQALLAFIEADGQIELFEYALQHMLVRHLDPHFGRRPRLVVPSASLSDCLDAATDLFSNLAYYGHDDMPSAQRAFAAGLACLKIGQHRDIHPLDACGLAKVGTALEQLDKAYPLVKQKILDGCVAVVSTDGRVTAEEAELLRAVSDALGCPVPPLLPDVPAAA
ncbi:MAG: M48 family metallopeptidase [Lentisphaerae bacterium]|nr:M48 family metallopeptidase [Lentisphaerota bacterium]